MKPMQFVLFVLPFTLMSILSCSESSSPCENTMCENGGVCIDGTCDCPVGFAGIHCQERATPDYVRITDMSSTRFPAFKSDGTWDAADGPDIFYRMFDGNRAIAQPDALFENAIATQTYSYIFAFIELNHLSAVHTIQLLDYDGMDTKEDFMGEIQFVPADIIKGLPKTITLDNGGPIAFTMTVEYYYNKD